MHRFHHRRNTISPHIQLLLLTQDTFLDRLSLPHRPVRHSAPQRPPHRYFRPPGRSFALQSRLRSGDLALWRGSERRRPHHGPHHRRPGRWSNGHDKHVRRWRSSTAEETGPAARHREHRNGCRFWGRRFVGWLDQWPRGMEGGISGASTRRSSRYGDGLLQRQGPHCQSGKVCAEASRLPRIADPDLRLGPVPLGSERWRQCRTLDPSPRFNRAATILSLPPHLHLR